MVRMARALRPEGINWPDYEDGRPCFKLEALTAANNLSHESAHDALSDVYATIALARLIRERQPKLFEYAYRLRDRKSTRLNSSHVAISYAVFCLKKKKTQIQSDIY